MSKRVLFVDDEQRILDGLRRMLHSMRHDWDMSFAISGPVALDVMAADPYDVIVTDMRMPGMDGAELLKEVMNQHPQTARIVLSGQADRETVLRAVGPTHQYLAKPCPPEALKATLARAAALSELLANQKLRRLISRMETIPSLPILYAKIVDELQSPDVSMGAVGQIVSDDMGMSTKVLQLVNSPLFGLRQRVSSPSQAVVLLGLETIRALVLSAHVFSRFDLSRLRSSSLNILWDHSIMVGAFARRIANVESSDQTSVDHAFTAGLLHDVGKLVLATNLPNEYRSALIRVLRERISLLEAEESTFGVTHAEVGAYLLGLWGLPDSVVTAAAFHHSPSGHPSTHFDPLTAAHVANGLAHEQRPKQKKRRADSEIDEAYLTTLGLCARLPVWRKICQDDVRGNGYP